LAAPEVVTVYEAVREPKLPERPGLTEEVELPARGRVEVRVVAGGTTPS